MTTRRQGGDEAMMALFAAGIQGWRPEPTDDDDPAAARAARLRREDARGGEAMKANTTRKERDAALARDDDSDVRCGGLCDDIIDFEDAEEWRTDGLCPACREWVAAQEGEDDDK